MSLVNKRVIFDRLVHRYKPPVYITSVLGDEPQYVTFM